MQQFQLSYLLEGGRQRLILQNVHLIGATYTKPAAHRVEAVVVEVVAGEPGLPAEVHALGVRDTYHHGAADQVELDHCVHKILNTVNNRSEYCAAM